MDFSRVAPFYRYLEFLVFGKALEARRRAFLARIGHPRAVLILGDGDGRFAAELLRSQNQQVARVDMVDISPGMVKLARKRLASLDAQGGGVRFVIGDVRDADLNGPYDLITSHFFLDCFSDAELASLVPRIARAASPGAQWLISEFAIPSGSLRLVARLMIRFMYFFFRVTAGVQTRNIPEYELQLRACGFQRLEIQSALAGLLVSELWVKSRLDRAEPDAPVPHRPE